jgi:hypothetical protein
VGGHHGVHAGRDRGAERDQGPVGEPVSVVVDHRQTQMRVDGGVAVPGEVFGACGHSPRLHAGDEGGGVRRGPVRVGSERADADDRVVGIDVDVGDGSVVQVDSAGGEVAADLAGYRAGQRDVVDRPQCRVTRPGTAARRLQPGHVATLLVNRDQRVRILRVHRRGQLGHLRGGGDVAVPEQHAAEPGAEVAAQPVRQAHPVEARLQDRGREASELVHRTPHTNPRFIPTALHTDPAPTRRPRAAPRRSSVTIDQSAHSSRGPRRSFPRTATRNAPPS